MKIMVMAALLSITGLAQAQEPVVKDNGADQVGNLAYDVVDNPASENGVEPVNLSRQKRGVAPIVGMPCESGYKSVGEDCVLANPEFE